MIVDIIAHLLVGLTIIYALAVVSILIGLCRLKQARSKEHPQVSTVVAARNEEERIERCLLALVGQDYPPDRYEIIVVDDSSEDQTAEIVRGFAKRYENVRLVKARQGVYALSPKKNAVNWGIKESIGEVILITDADCSPPQGWISGMVSYFEPEVGVVAGFSPAADDESLWGKLMGLESLSSAVIAAGSIGIGVATTCVGRNLAYRRETFDEVQGFGETGKAISGDDDLFIQRIDHKTGWKLRFATSRDTFVPTTLTKRLTDFINRKKRHISAGVFYSPTLIVLGILVYLYNLLLLVTVPGAFLLSGFWLPSACLGTKIIFDLGVLAQGARLFRKRGLLKFLPLAEILHIPYLVVIQPLAILGGFEWKGRAYR